MTIDSIFIRSLLFMKDGGWDETKHPREKNGRFTSGAGSNGGNTETRAPKFEGMVVATSNSFKPRTKSVFRNKRDEIVAEQIALRKQQGLSGMPDCTIDPDTRKEVNFDDGYQVAFQTSISEVQGNGYISDTEYDKLVQELSKQTGSKPYIGVFEKPEVSFHCKTFQEAMDIAKRFNQQSIFNWKAANTLEWKDENMDIIFPPNPDYDANTNHVKGR